MSILAECPKCGQDNSYQVNVVAEKYTEMQPLVCCACGEPFMSFINPVVIDKEKAADEKAKKLIEAYGIIGACMNPYEPFDVVIDYDWEIEQLQKAKEYELNRPKTLEEAMERLDKALKSLEVNEYEDNSEGHSDS